MSNNAIQNKKMITVAEFSKIILCLRRINSSLLLSATVGSLIIF